MLEHPIPSKSSWPIGIITGSGPEAGIDLWQRILAVAKTYYGEGYRGDLDAPQITACSNPTLGLSMELERFEPTVWRALLATSTQVIQNTKIYTVACNTLNIYAQKLREVHPQHHFISYAECVFDYIKSNAISSMALMAATPVLQMNKLSVYAPLKNMIDIELPLEPNKCQQLIYDIKRQGRNRQLQKRAYNIIDEFKSDHILLACTEYSLLGLDDYPGEKKLTNVSQLVAEKMFYSALKS